MQSAWGLRKLPSVSEAGPRKLRRLSQALNRLRLQLGSLGIARAIAHSHGAQIRLSNRAQGGLRAEVVFPAAMGM